MSNYQETMQNFAQYLSEKSGHNTIAKNMEGSSSNGFLCEILTSDESFLMKIRVEKSIDYATVDIYPGITVQEHYRAMTAQFCMNVNSDKKVGNLRISREHGDVYFHMEASFQDAALTGKTLENMERIALSILHSVRIELNQIAHGSLPSKGYDDGNNLVEVLKQLRSLHDQAGKSEDLPCVSDLFPDFSSLFSEESAE